MADQPQSFEQALETDMQQLMAEIKNRREKPELVYSSEKEIVKDALRVFPRLEKPVTASAPAPQPQAKPNQSSPLPAYAQDAPAEVKLEIEYLIDLAFRDGLSKALGEADKSPYFVQDAFHDALAGKLYPELQKRGIVQ